MIMTVGVSAFAFVTIFIITAEKPNIITGMISIGTTIIEMIARRSRSVSFSSLK
jgi:hypothetical protein